MLSSVKFVKFTFLINLYVYDLFSLFGLHRIVCIYFNMWTGSMIWITILLLWLQVEGFWLPVGSEAPERSDHYVLTASVRSNLKDIARVITAR